MSILGMEVYETRSKCSKCNNWMFMHPIYDACFCHKCDENKWKESTCTEFNEDGTVKSSCEFCIDRPEKPMDNGKCLTEKNKQDGYRCEYC